MEFGAVALWLALYLAVLFVGMHVTAVVFPRLADRGASVALPLGFVVFLFVAYYGGRLYAPATALLGVGVLGALALAARRRGVTADRRTFLEVGLVFTAAFSLMVAARAVEPGVVPAGGEKFLDFGLLQAILRAETIPPEDFWFAGEPMSYYYGGHLVVAQLTRITGTAPGVAYNIALSGFYATYVTVAYGLAGNVAARDGDFERRAAVLGAFFVAVAGTLFTPLRVLLRPLPDDLAEPIARKIAVWAGRFPDSSAGTLVTDRQSFSSWDATGVIDGTIHEVPLFAFLNGDLHAHMMAPPVTLLAATGLFAYWLTPGTDRWRRLGLLFGLIPAVAGMLAVVNTWSFPSVAGLTFLTVLFDRDAVRTLLPDRARARVGTLGVPGRELVGFVLAGLAAVGVAVFGVVWSLPFWLANVAGRSVAFLPDRSSLAELLVVHGGFLLPIALYGGYLVWARYDCSRRTLTGLAALAVGGMAVTALLTVPAVGLLAPFLLGGYLLGSRFGDAAADRLPVDDDRLATLPGFELVFVLGAVGLVLIVEFVYLDADAASGRFNTVFKTYAQVWALFAVGAAVAVGRLLQTVDVSPPTPRWSSLVRGVVAVLVVSLSVYGVLTINTHFWGPDADGNGTLDGTTALDDHDADLAGAVDWLDGREGTPTIVTAPGESYRWESVPSAYTGLPTIIGWEGHEHSWGRPWAAIQDRSRHVGSIYGSNDRTQRELLVRYDVSYVVVGPSEQDRYGENITVEDLAAVQQAVQFGDVTVYEVDQGSLASQVSVAENDR